MLQGLEYALNRSRKMILHILSSATHSVRFVEFMQKYFDLKNINLFMCVLIFANMD